MSRRTMVLVALALFVPGIIAAVSADDTLGDAIGAGEPDSVIVELGDEPGAVWAARQEQAGRTVSEAQLEGYRAQLRATQDRLLDEIRTQGIAAEVRTVDVPDGTGGAVTVELRYTLVYNGVNLLVDPDAVEAIAALDGVAAVHPDREYQTLLDHSVDYTRAPQVYGSDPALTRYDAQTDGVEGQGTYISVIDTGVDWTHEMFGGDPTPPRYGVAPDAEATPSNTKVVYNLPLAGDPQPDGHGHGTHVASTAAGYLGFAPGADRIPGTDADVPVHGVAPQARIMAYDVCVDALATAGSLVELPVGSCLGSSIVLAIEDSVSPRTVNNLPKPVADVINISLGGTGGPDSPNSVAASNAALTGAVVVSSAGNSGPGEGTVGAPAAGTHVIAVGANNDPGDLPNVIDVLDLPDAPEIFANYAEHSNATFPLDEPIQAHFVDCGLALVPADCGPQASGRIAISERGPGPFAQKAATAQAAGAVALVIFNDEDGPIDGTMIAPAGIPVFGISRADGLFLAEDVGFDDDGLSLHELLITPGDADRWSPEMAGFSSRGPVAGFGQVKPDVTGPGVSILAGAPPASLLGALGWGGYSSVSGTSMSGPHVAGAAALIRQANPGWSPDMVRTALINTATNLRGPDGTPRADGAEATSIHGQGGGLIDVAAAVNAPALLGVTGDGIDTPGILGSHSFGEVANAACPCSDEVAVTLRDLSGEGGTYELRLVDNRNTEIDGVTVGITGLEEEDEADQPRGRAAQAPGRGGQGPPGRGGHDDGTEDGRTQVTIPAGGEVSFTATISVDGLEVDDEAVSILWYVVAESADGPETLRMPLYVRVAP